MPHSALKLWTGRNHHPDAPRTRLRPRGNPTGPSLGEKRTNTATPDHDRCSTICTVRRRGGFLHREKCSCCAPPALRWGVDRPSDELRQCPRYTAFGRKIATLQLNAESGYAGFCGDVRDCGNARPTVSRLGLYSLEARGGFKFAVVLVVEDEEQV
jgi:hypothetical protein